MLTDIFPEDPAASERREAFLLGLAFLFLTATAVVLLLAPAAQSAEWSRLGDRWRHLLVLPIWLGCVLIARRTLRRKLPTRDPVLLPVGMLLAGWGVLLVWRLLPDFGLRQLGWLVLSTLLLVAVVRIGPDLRWLRQYRYLWLASGLLLTALTLVFGTHPSASEPRLWLGCCGIYFQPSELLRLLLIVFLASYLGDRLSESWERQPPTLLPVLAPLLAVWGLSVSLLFIQRDLGTGSLFLALLALLLYVATGRKEVPVLGAAMLLLGGAAAALTFGMVRGRLLAWVNPWVDPLGVGYQVIQAGRALAAGGLSGEGFGLGSPEFVPAAHTDFVYATVAEEWGLLGSIGLLALIAVLVSRGLRVAVTTDDTFSLMLAAGLSIGLGLQTVLIVGGVVRLLPLTGVTLPFVSYGGSSLSTSFIGLGLLLRLSAARGGRSARRRGLLQVQGALLLAFLLVALASGWWALVRAPALLAAGV